MNGEEPNQPPSDTPEGPAGPPEDTVCPICGKQAKIYACWGGPRDGGCFVACDPCYKAKIQRIREREKLAAIRRKSRGPK